MYWSISDFPSIRSLSPADQRRVVTEAGKKFDSQNRLRFWLALITCFVPLVWLSRTGIWPYHLGESPFGVAVLGGMLFYGFLLWDINGPTRRAVERYARESSIA